MFKNGMINSANLSGPEVIKIITCYFLLLINVKMPTIVGILTFLSRKNSILGLSEPENS